MRRVLVGAVLVLTACTHRPPPDYAPDPGLVARVKAIHMVTPAWVCPGQTITASYTAELFDGGDVPFATTYDKNHPPELHVVFLNRSSPDAIPLENGNWDTFDDPMQSVMQGFPLRVSLRSRPAMATQDTIGPEYDCLNHVFHFEGRDGGRGQAGGDGPDVTVRLAILRSPFVERLLVIQVKVEHAPPFYVLANAAVVPPADWLLIESRGGRGGRGRDGRRGADGVDGTAGCPGSPGGPGGAGGDGGAGAPGGRGGRITVVVPRNHPFLAGLVDARVAGGDGGRGGKGGAGGAGGNGGAATPGAGRRCQVGPDGPNGAAGRAGRDGRDGPHGARPQVVTVAAASVFGPNASPELVRLLNYQRQE